MEIEFQNTKQDYIDFYKLQLKNALFKKLWVFVLCAFFIVGSIYNEHLGSLKFVLNIIVYGIALVCIIYFLPLLIVVLRINRLISKEGAYINKRKFIITDEGLKSEGATHTSLRNWDSIDSAGANERFIFIKLADKKNLIIPKYVFISDVEATNFLRLIQKYSRKINLNFDINYTPVEKPNYRWGYLSLIPLIGAINGVIMIAVSIFKYKDIKYGLLGLGGILVSIAVYGPLVYQSNKGAVFIDASRTQMNSLVKEIEFYKMQNGTYPDNLEQLDYKNSFINIHDPIENAQKNDHYNYHKIENKYTLFSSGVDHIPNTKDDLYPTIDTAKTGLIIPSIKH